MVARSIDNTDKIILLTSSAVAVSSDTGPKLCTLRKCYFNFRKKEYNFSNLFSYFISILHESRLGLSRLRSGLKHIF